MEIIIIAFIMFLVSFIGFYKRVKWNKKHGRTRIISYCKYREELKGK